ncbi:PaaX family transcriptional regulator [Actinosynnema sp. CA-248983]
MLDLDDPALDAPQARGTQPRQLIVTLYGLYARPSGGWLAVGSLVRLLAELGVDEPAVRSSVSRLKRRGILRPHAVDGIAGYALTEQAQEILREGDYRIFERVRASMADGWLLAVFSVPESERQKRHVLRTQLTKLGFGTAAPGVWIAPAHVYEEVAERLTRLGLRDYVNLFRADYLSALPDLADKVRQWWDLDALDRLYADFRAAYSAGEPGEPSEREAFVAYVRILTDWRRLPYLDPGLPPEVLPRKWSGTRAVELFESARARLEGPARRHAMRVISHR